MFVDEASGTYTGQGCKSPHLHHKDSMQCLSNTEKSKDEKRLNLLVSLVIVTAVALQTMLLRVKNTTLSVTTILLMGVIFRIDWCGKQVETNRLIPQVSLKLKANNYVAPKTYALAA